MKTHVRCHVVFTRVVVERTSNEGILPPGQARQRDGWSGAGSWRSTSFPTSPERGSVQGSREGRQYQHGKIHTRFCSVWGCVITFFIACPGTLSWLSLVFRYFFHLHAQDGLVFLLSIRLRVGHVSRQFPSFVIVVIVRFMVVKVSRFWFLVHRR